LTSSTDKGIKGYMPTELITIKIDVNINNNIAFRPSTRTSVIGLTIFFDRSLMTLSAI